MQLFVNFFILVYGKNWIKCDWNQILIKKPLRQIQIENKQGISSYQLDDQGISSYQLDDQLKYLSWQDQLFLRAVF